jgi:hypothetical protein
MMSVMQHQHLRVMYSRVDEAITDLKQATEKANEIISELEKSRESQG